MPSVIINNPYPSTFGEITDLTKADEVGQYVYSRAIVPAGEGGAISVLDGPGSYKINDGDWTALPGVYQGGDFLFARTQIPTQDNVTTVTTFNIGTFTVSTGTTVVPTSFDNYTGENNYDETDHYQG